MIIKKIRISNLHGQHENKEIEFNEKLTFLYGANGCGKTTVLNILTAIVTGKLYNLCDYKFDKIELFFLNQNNKEKKFVVEMSLDEESKRLFRINIDNKKYIIDDIDNLKERMYRMTEDENIDKTFFVMYPFLKNIVNKFNYVYLPLNRYGYDSCEERDYYRYGFSRRRYYEIQSNTYNSYLNESLRYISELIKDNCVNINIHENRLNDKFRRDVLSSMIHVSSDMPIGEFIKEISHFNWEEVLNSKDAYIKTLKEIGVYDNKLKKEIEAYFEAFKNAYDDYVKQKNNDQERTRISIDLAWQYTEFQKIKSIAEIAMKTEKIKEKIRHPKILFEELINDFFESSGTHKRVKITNEGEVIFKTRGDNLLLKDLSSGEKQIVITFASLIFGLKGDGTGIFIVDEPEASLHLEWQNKFVPAILKTNIKLQLIFATHSPELIGKYRNNAVRLK